MEEIDAYGTNFGPGDQEIEAEYVHTLAIIKFANELSEFDDLVAGDE